MHEVEYTVYCELVQGVAGNKKGEFEVEAQFLSKLHTNNA
jgi:hypothetical protein